MLKWPHADAKAEMGTRLLTRLPEGSYAAVPNKYGCLIPRLVEAQAALSESRNARASYRAEVRRNLHEREAQADPSATRPPRNKRRPPSAKSAPPSPRQSPCGPATCCQHCGRRRHGSPGADGDRAGRRAGDGGGYAGQQGHRLRQRRPGRRNHNDDKHGAIFPMTLALDATTLNVDGKMIRRAPGMSLTAEVKTGKRRVIEYLLSPIQKAGGEGLSER